MTREQLEGPRREEGDRILACLRSFYSRATSANAVEYMNATSPYSLGEEDDARITIMDHRCVPLTHFGFVFQY